MTRAELVAEAELQAIRKRESPSESPFVPAALRDDAAGEDISGEEALDAWLRFRPASASDE